MVWQANNLKMRDDDLVKKRKMLRVNKWVWNILLIYSLFIGNHNGDKKKKIISYDFLNLHI